MSLFENMGRHRKAVIGLGIVAVSLFGAIAPAAAASPSRTTLTTSTPTIGVGGIAKLKAVVKPGTGTVQPTGTVTFREGTTATSPPVGPAVTLALLNSVQTAKVDLPSLAIGTHTFIATYSGSTVFNASTSLTMTIVVTAVPKIDSTTVASTTTPEAAPGEEVKLKAVVKQVSGTVKPTGTVTFSQGGVTLGAGPVPLVLIGVIETAKLPITTLTNGTHTIIATYSGSSTSNASTSAAITVTVGKIDTTCILTTKPSTNQPGKTVMAVEVQPASGTGIPTGTGFFTIDTQAPQVYTLSLVTGKAQISYPFPAPAATHTVKVTYDGDAAYNACPLATKTFTAP